jgi:hypothetical protein
VYPHRTKNRVFEVLVDKVEIIRSELGSLGTVVAEQLTTTLECGIRKGTKSTLDAASALWLGMVTMRIHRPSRRSALTALNDCEPPEKEFDDARRVRPSQRGHAVARVEAPGSSASS